MGKLTGILACAVLLAASIASGSSVTIPNEFSNGTTASASQVNANFDAVEVGIDDNDSRLDTIIAARKVYYATDYASGSSTGGIEEAVNAACTAGGGIVQAPFGTTSSTATVNLDCDGVILRGHWFGSILSRSAGATAIKITGDWVGVEDLYVTHASSNASNIGIDMDNDGSTVSAWFIRNVRLLGQGAGTGVRCEGCLKGRMEGGQVSSWTDGYLALEATGPIAPNANVVSGSTFNLNTDKAFQISNLQGAMTFVGVTMESNGTGIWCESDGEGHIQIIGSHMEANTTADLHRPASGCGFNDHGSRFGTGSGYAFIKDSSGATDDTFLGSYFNGGDFDNNTTDPVRIVYPSNDATVTYTAYVILDDESSKQSECWTLYAPTDTIADTNDLQSMWRAPRAATIVEVWCETDTGTVTADLQIDDGTPADVMGTDLVCDSTGESDSTSLTGSMADGDRLDLAITSVATSPTRLTFCAEYRWN